MAAVLTAGDTFSHARSFSVAEVLAFAEFSGDKGRHHIEPDAQGRLVVHALLTLSIVTKIGGDNHFLLRDMQCSFLRPVFSDEQISCLLTVTEAEDQGNRTALKLGFTCTNPAGKEVLVGAGQGVILHSANS